MKNAGSDRDIVLPSAAKTPAISRGRRGLGRLQANSYPFFIVFQSPEVHNGVDMIGRRGFGGMTVALLLGAFALPAAAQPGVPSYAQNEQSIRGTVSGFDGKYDLTVRDVGGYVDRVQLHDGTVINPTGLTLHSGMTVTIYGHADGPRFIANEIDTPYHRTYPAYYGYPYPPYAYYGGWYGSPGPYFRARVGFWF
jgi:hypothetical protein